MTCTVCGGDIGWVDCPTGGWWAHDSHPEDDHDAEPKVAFIPAWMHVTRRAF